MRPDQMPRKPETDVWPLPCPFCGGRDVSTHEGSTFRWMYAGCDNCGAQAGEVRMQTLGDGAKEEWVRDARQRAIEEWNKRPNNQI